MSDDTPIVFVDIDGVLNNALNYHEWNAAHDAGLKERLAAGMEDDRWVSPADDPYVLKLFDGPMVSRLQNLCDQTGAAVVVSSSWRMFYASRFQKLADILRAAGVSAPIVGPTPTVCPNRWDAINLWLHTNRKNQKVRYAILDDEAPQFRMICTDGHLVQTAGHVGLTDKDVERAVKNMKRGRTIT
jgi:hypothetical protein